MGSCFRIVILLSLLLPAWLGNARASDTSLIVAIVPQFAPTQINRDWAPLLARLEQMTGYRFQLRIYDQISAFESDLARSIPDIAFMNPYHMVLAKQSHNYRPLVRDKAALSGLLVVRRDGPIKKLADLNNQTLAFPSPNALGASLYMRALLTEKEGLKFTPTYVGNHQTVYRQVLLGEAAAGGGVRKTFDKEPDLIHAQLRILYTTPDLAPHPLAAHPRVPLAVGKKIVSAMLAMHADPEAQTLLRAIQMSDPIEADYARDYEPLSRLKLEHYTENAPK